MASEGYEAQVRLLVRVLAELGDQDRLALKGGTAINLFVQDLPRLSVDIDLTYTGTEERETALLHIHEALSILKTQLEARGLRVNPTALPQTTAWVKLAVSDARVQVKVEVAPVLRGTVHPPERRRTRPAVEARFGYAEVPVLALPDLYAGKLMAALDRQHPRDLYDVHLFLEQGRLDTATVQAFLVYLISHNRPLHEILRPRLKDVSQDYDRAFVGMTVEPVPLPVLEAGRIRLIAELHAAMTEEDRGFLMDVAAGQPDWARFSFPEAADLPAVRWKLHNIARMTPVKRRAATEALRQSLSPEGTAPVDP
jgi:predicted nucleotidyltransferase component of viral defense system